jgi:hypothetical protein
MIKGLFIIAAVLLSACSVPTESGVKVIVGARVENPRMDHSVVVIAEGKIRAVGTQAAVPVPKGSEITSGLGMTVMPLDGSGPLEAGAPANLVLKGPTKRVMRNGEWVP